MLLDAPAPPCPPVPCGLVALLVVPDDAAVEPDVVPDVSLEARPSVWRLHPTTAAQAPEADAITSAAMRAGVASMPTVMSAPLLRVNQLLTLSQRTDCDAGEAPM